MTLAPHHYQDVGMLIPAITILVGLRISTFIFRP